MSLVDQSTNASYELFNEVALSKSVEQEKEQVWEQLTDEGPSGSSDSENGSSLHLSGSDTEQSGHDSDCISGLVSSSTSDNEQEPKVVAQNAMCDNQSHGVAYQRRSRKAPLAHELSSKLLQVSAGRPIKVWLSPNYKPLKVLDPKCPAHKKPVFSEYAGKPKKLDPTLPAKKHIPEWLLSCGSTAAATKPTSIKPPKMPFRAPQATEACCVAAPR